MYLRQSIVRLVGGEEKAYVLIRIHQHKIHPILLGNGEAVNKFLKIKRKKDVSDFLPVQIVIIAKAQITFVKWGFGGLNAQRNHISAG